MFHPAGLQQAGTHQNSAAVSARLALFHTFISLCCVGVWFGFFRESCSAAGRQQP